MDDRTEIAAKLMQGILIGYFMDRPRANPTPEKVAEIAVSHADALLRRLKPEVQ